MKSILAKKKLAIYVYSCHLDNPWEYVVKIVPLPYKQDMQILQERVVYLEVRTSLVDKIFQAIFQMRIFLLSFMIFL